MDLAKGNLLEESLEGRKILKDTICEIAVVSRPRECYTFLMEALSLLPDREARGTTTTTFVAAAALLRGLSRLMIRVESGRMKSDRARYLVGIVAMIQRKFFAQSKDGSPSYWNVSNDCELLEEICGACIELITTYGYDAKVGAALQEDPKESSCRLEVLTSLACLVSEELCRGVSKSRVGLPLLGDSPEEYKLQDNTVGRLLNDVNCAVYHSPGILQYTYSRVLTLVPHEETGLMQSSDGVSALDMARSRLGWLVLAFVERPRRSPVWMPLVWSHAVYTHIFACTVQLLFESNDIIAIRSGLRLFGKELQEHLPHQDFIEGARQRWNPGNLFRHVLEIAITSDEAMMTLEERQRVYTIVERDLRTLPIEERLETCYQIEKTSRVDQVVGIILKLYKDDWWSEVLQQPDVVRLSLVDKFTQAIQTALTGDFKVVDGTDTIIGAVNWCIMIWLADPINNATARHIRSSQWLSGVVTSLVEGVASQIDAELRIVAEDSADEELKGVEKSRLQLVAATVGRLRELLTTNTLAKDVDDDSVMTDINKS
ncbi:hypothetical protein Pmar_PMAR013252 [Perkinsus marinus ATCC 50983]|uniref:Uncharacterized protein n=1 Tax=Perkinsus marinus (strain ATCC 50983 / TXsc) TaxID=423536 RepID=C5LEW0_PERM5|nr:hypothetical protein Pmar_PMAR013252 [Perkinsus marinus ATCC 50983]EER04726.1 hypothetical protein Pmar_PMAR013252 [Perkinsus marinus ATCC 50983]|eukprot:XP_002772910.1 hypothetical protein Pmar_PMAR013252 [Perkinsus marinus ATCC 50983]